METKPVEQKEMHYTYAVDQKVSVNAYFDTEISGESVRFQITARHGSKTPVIVETLDAVIAAYTELRVKYPRPVAIVPGPAPVTEPTRVAIGDNGQPLPEIKSLVAEKLIVGLKPGTTDQLSCHITGKPWTKFGVPLYPEVWEAAGLKIVIGQPVPEVAGWTAEYICKPDGKPLKVTRLLPSK